MITIQIPQALRLYADGESEIRGEAVSLREAMALLQENCPQVHRRVMAESGETREHINLFVNRTLVRSLDGPDAVIRAGDIVTILPAISGG